MKTVQQTQKQCLYSARPEETNCYTALPPSSFGNAQSSEVADRMAPEKQHA